MNTTSQWRLSRNLIEEYQTPSGLVIRAKKVEILSLVEQGLIPTPLLAVADQVVEGKSAVELSEFREFMPLVAAVVKAAVVYPKIVDEPVAADDDTKVGIDELSFADKMAVFEWSIDGGEVMGGKLKKFFEKSRINDVLALDMLAKRYGQRPSEIAGVSALGDWISYQFDIFICQRGLKAEMDLLQDESKPALTSTGFAAPPSAVKAVKIKPDGTWDSE